MKFDESIPIYLQIKQEIENAIISNSIKEEKSIPSIRVLAKQYELNPQTISNAVNELLNDGILFKKRGIGMFVEAGAKKKLMGKISLDFRENDIKKLVSTAISLNLNKEDILKLIEAEYDKGGQRKWKKIILRYKN